MDVNKKSQTLSKILEDEQHLPGKVVEISKKINECKDKQETLSPTENSKLNWLQLALKEQPRKLSIANIFGAVRLPQQQSRDSFHRAIYPILLVAQIFCLMPVAGISATSPAALKFKWSNLRTINSIAFIFIAILAFGIELIRASNEELSAKSLSK